jgi:hypothetical protein
MRAKTIPDAMHVVSQIVDLTIFSQPQLFHLQLQQLWKFMIVLAPVMLILMPDVGLAPILTVD